MTLPRPHPGDRRAVNGPPSLRRSAPEQAQHYGDAVAEIYDEMLEPMRADTAAAVESLADMAPRGRALEFGVGTGRISLPLAARGLRVHGIDASTRMIAALRAKDADGVVTTSVGDISEAVVDGEFDLVIIAFNTLCALLTQERQLACIEEAARRLPPSGGLGGEACVPRPERYDHPEVGPGGPPGGGRHLLMVSGHDGPSQIVAARQPIPEERSMRLLPVRLRYVWPSELDLMARLGGLRLVARHGGWRGEPFTGTSTNHVSIYAPTRTDSGRDSGRAPVPAVYPTSPR